MMGKSSAVNPASFVYIRIVAVRRFVVWKSTELLLLNNCSQCKLMLCTCYNKITLSENEMNGCSVETVNAT